MEITNRRTRRARRLEDRCGRIEADPGREGQAFDHIDVAIDRRAGERGSRMYRRRYDGRRRPRHEICAVVCRRFGRPL